jgi:cytochrome c oxidase subunit 1
MTASPPKEHNFDAIPTVGHLDEFFHRKYEDRGTEDHHDYHQVATAEDLLAEQEANAEKHIHLPSPSYWPILLAFALPIMAYGVIYNILLIAAGALLALVSLYGWGMEPHTATDDDYDPPTTGTDLEVASHG